MKVSFLNTGKPPTDEEWERLKLWRKENPLLVWRRRDPHPTNEGVFFSRYTSRKKNGESWGTLESIDKEALRTKEWQLANKETVNKTAKKYIERKLEEDPEYVRDGHKRYIAGPTFQARKDDRRIAAAERRLVRKKTDPVFKFKVAVSNLIRETMKRGGFKKAKKTEEILGIPRVEFREYIESLFEPWMNWDNYGGGNCSERNVRWELDHIIPISAATNEEEALKLNHYSNLRPLCVYENRNIKRAKLI